MSERSRVERVARWWNDYWFRPSPSFDLAVCRIGLIGFELFMLCVPFAVLTIPPIQMMAIHAALPLSDYQPLPILQLITLPLGGDYRPTLEHLEWVYLAAQISGVIALVGFWTRTAAAVFALARTFLIAHMFSYGEFHHIETVSTIFLLLLPFSPCGRVLSVDAWLARRRDRAAGRPVLPILEVRDPFAGWPMRVIRIVFAIVYLSAAMSKVLGSGLDWLNGYTLQRYVLQGALYWGSDVGVALAHHFHLIVALGWFSVIFESTFVAVLRWPRLALLYLPLGILFHVGIWVTIRAPFMIWLICYSAFVPWSRVAQSLLSTIRRPGAPRPTP
jgi:uncharacterized membrane protein YphA (DoxX/SURF4 family)